MYELEKLGGTDKTPQIFVNGSYFGDEEVL
jgi:hypothetical protein